MDKATQWLAGLLLVLVLAVGAPVGIAVASGWTPAQTNSLMTGMFAVCGGSVALVALGFGVAAGLNLTSSLRDNGPRTSTKAPDPHVVDVDLEHIKRQRALVDYQRALAGLERDRRALAPPEQQAAQVDPADAWLAELPAWEFVDAAAE